MFFIRWVWSTVRFKALSLRIHILLAKFIYLLIFGYFGSRSRKQYLSDFFELVIIKNFGIRSLLIMINMLKCSMFWKLLIFIWFKLKKLYSLIKRKRHCFILANFLIAFLFAYDLLNPIFSLYYIKELVQSLKMIYNICIFPKPFFKSFWPFREKPKIIP